MVLQWVFPRATSDQRSGIGFIPGLFPRPVVAVTSIRDPNPAGKVGVLVDFGIVDIHTFRAFRLDLGQMGPNWGEVFNGFSH